MPAVAFQRAPKPHRPSLLPTALFVFCTKSRRAERYWQKTLLQMEEMESQIREEIRKGRGWGPSRNPRSQLPHLGSGFEIHSQSPARPPGFAELQTDMTDLTKELNRSQGIPFLEYKHFVTRTFFPKVSLQPHPPS